MNWDDLKIFLDVARQPKLEYAANQLKVDATTVSRRLRRLETSLGVTLFERTRRGHVLTPAGEALAQRVETMESLVIDIDSDHSGEATTSGRIRLGAPEGLGTTVLAPTLKSFKSSYPNINVDLIALSGVISVPKREADMSLLLARPTAGRLKIRRLSDYTLGLYGAKKFLNQCEPITSLQQLNDQTLIGYVDDLIYSSQLKYFGDVLPDRAPDLCSTSINAQLQMVKSGAGLGILPKFMAVQHAELTRVLTDDIHIKRTFWLAVHEDVASLKRNRLMSDFLTESLGALP